MNNRLRFIIQGGIIAAIYAVLTILFAPISYGQGLVSVRISEALTILPFFTPAAIPGLFVGCILANIYGGLGLVDIVFGSLATLVAAALTYGIRKYKWIAPLPPVIINGIVVGIILHVLYDYPLVISMISVGFGQAIACYFLGMPLLLSLEKYGKKLFHN